ncbi:hypothetical protein FH608_027610 [Nonomuraea phyllanthi]|uniref:Uncharacterized protein n=1 Tax=Nonomuraea phyllanthi TaxID=2219224 RepID=A0A5C4W421_9ACTN|nr:hypothetical protein [Nonomuraea phyllanthi]KAB8191744.1 hypothetical protein FH608_027610 [Nonomuraea phyllanthi]QFY10173.1 hypothetical protein GBF35_29200 [Nonomuraea phyllanthi]
MVLGTLLALLVPPHPAWAAPAPSPPATDPARRPAPSADPVTTCSSIETDVPTESDGTGGGEQVCVRAWRGEEAARRSAAAATRRTPTAAPRPLAFPDEPSACGFGSPGSFKQDPNRFTSCSEVWWELITSERDSDGTVEITGSLNLNNRQWNLYDATAVTWTHGLTITVHDGAGTLATGARAQAVSLCDEPGFCLVDQVIGLPDDMEIDLVPGHSYSYGWIEKENGGAAANQGAVVPLSFAGARLIGFAQDQVPPWVFTDDNLWGRCDGSLPGARAGCVNPYHTPTFIFERALYGAAADMIAWAQQNLAGAWGSRLGGRPMHYLYSTADGNRNVMCRTFVQDDTLNAQLSTYPPRDSTGRPEIDSCDEFPFNASYESGAMQTDVNGNPKPHITDGAQCAQVIAAKSGSTGNLALDFARVVPLERPTGFELCVRGHIPYTLNVALGRDGYLRQIRGFRTLDMPGYHDPFWIQVI